MLNSLRPPLGVVADATPHPRRREADPGGHGEEGSRPATREALDLLEQAMWVPVEPARSVLGATGGPPHEVRRHSLLLGAVGHGRQVVTELVQRP
ncbi:MAG TPA: hypothetical protein VFJ12_10890 [Segeticoccus sp.]|nr:hypothetical protein [Segeticoccus sp.]